MTSPSLAVLMAHLEELWGHYDTVLQELAPEVWQHKFGREWVYADVPRHLAYFDQEVIAEGVACGPAAPAAQLAFMRTHREFNAWNARRLAEYRRDQTVEYALAQMQAGRAAIRQAVAPLGDADLDQPVWFPLAGFAGWRTVRYALEFCRQHTWAHFTQLRLRLKRATPVVSPAVTHGALNGVVHSLAPLLNHTLAQQVRLTAALVLTGPGGGVWAIRVADGECAITAGWPAHADLTLTQSPATLIEVLSGMRHPLTAVAAGRIRVGGWRRLPRFLQLFPRPRLDQPLKPVP